MERKSIIKCIFLAVCIPLLISACCSKKQAAVKGSTEEVAPPVKSAGEKGVLKNMSGLDGCKWMIELDNGTKLQPTNLAAFDIALEDGKPVNVVYTEQTGVMSTCMAGKVVKITTISLR